MKMKLILNITLYLLPAIIILNGCESDTEFTDADKYAKVYMPQAVEYPVENSLIMTDEAQDIIYGAAYGGPAFPGNSIDVSFEVNFSLVDTYNDLNETSYVPMPEGSFELGQTMATIPKGGVSTEPLTIKVTTIGALQPLVDYLLPVSIVDISGNAEINETLQTTYFHVRGTFSEFSRSEWEIIDVDSEQLNPPLLASATIDGDPGTFWHSQYNPDRPPLPHHITIDMGEAQKLHGIRMIKRGAGARGNPKEITIEVSNDGESWTEGEDFTTTFDVEKESTFYLSSTVEARYLKVTVTESFGEPGLPITHFAEVYAF